MALRKEISTEFCPNCKRTLRFIRFETLEGTSDTIAVYECIHCKEEFLLVV